MRRPLVHAALVLLLVISAVPAILGPDPGHPSLAVVLVTPSPSPSALPTAVPPPPAVADERPAPLSLDMAVSAR